MPITSFESLPDHARLWAFAADGPLDESARDALLPAVDAFLAQWAAHGTPLTAGRELRYDRFLFVGADEQAAGVSGCSIDALVHRIRDLEQRLGRTMTDNAPVSFRVGEEFRRVSRAEFRALAERGEVNPNTVVFDNTIPSVGDLRAGRWEVPAREAWHGRVFFKAVGR